MLAFFTLPKPLDEQLRLYPPPNLEERTAIEQVYKVDLKYAKQAVGKRVFEKSATTLMETAS